jgi:hypothetical protein
LKPIWRARFEALRDRLVLTPKERRVIAFVVTAFLLGLCAKCYRENHPQKPPQMDKKHPGKKHQTALPSSAPSPAKMMRESRPFISVSTRQSTNKKRRSSGSPLPNWFSLSMARQADRNAQLQKVLFGLV